MMKRTFTGEIVCINGHDAEYFVASAESASNSLVWIDEKKRIIFALNGNIDQTVIVTIAGKIRLADSIK